MKEGIGFTIIEMFYGIGAGLSLVLFLQTGIFTALLSTILLLLIGGILIYKL